MEKGEPVTGSLWKPLLGLVDDENRRQRFRRLQSFDELIDKAYIAAWAFIRRADMCAGKDTLGRDVFDRGNGLVSCQGRIQNHRDHTNLGAGEERLCVSVRYCQYKATASPK